MSLFNYLFHNLFSSSETTSEKQKISTKKNPTILSKDESVTVWSIPADTKFVNANENPLFAKKIFFIAYEATLPSNWDVDSYSNFYNAENIPLGFLATEFLKFASQNDLENKLKQNKDMLLYKRFNTTNGNLAVLSLFTLLPEDNEPDPELGYAEYEKLSQYLYEAAADKSYEYDCSLRISSDTIATFGLCLPTRNDDFAVKRLQEIVNSIALI